MDVFSRDGSSELINRARRAVELGYYPVAGRDQARVMEHVDHLLRRKTSADWQSSELARRILITGSPEYQQIFAKMVIAGLRGMPEASGLTREEQQLVQRNGCGYWQRWWFRGALPTRWNDRSDFQPEHQPIPRDLSSAVDHLQHMGTGHQRGHDCDVRG